jgi:hypothetical protein
MNDAPLMTACEELGALLRDPRVPDDVRAARLRLSQCPTKVFCTTGRGIPLGYWPNYLARIRGVPDPMSAIGKNRHRADTPACR